MEEFFVDNRNIKKQIMPAYGKVIDVMKTKLNHAEVYQEIDLFNRESRIMFEILKFNPDFKKNGKKIVSLSIVERKIKVMYGIVMYLLKIQKIMILQILVKINVKRI